jgi:uncharacterized membrane protein
MTIARPWAVILLVVLVLSVAANLLIAGFVVARIGGGGPKPPNLIDRIVSFGIRAFPPGIQESIKDQSRDQRDKLRVLVDAAVDARMRMFEAMRTEPFDPAALDAAFADLQARTTDLQRVGQEIVANAIAAAPPEERAEIRPPRGPFP